MLPLGIPARYTWAQESDYRIIRGQRLGRYELGKSLETLSLGNPTSRWENSGRRGPYADAYWFVTRGIRVYICKSDGLTFAIVAWGNPSHPDDSTSEAARYETAEGIGIGTTESDLLRILGRPDWSGEEGQRVGGIDLKLKTSLYSGLQVHVNRATGKVIALGVVTPSNSPGCQSDVNVLQALREAAIRPPLVVTRPVAMTSCEASELRRLLHADVDSRRLLGSPLTVAEQAVEESPSPLPRIQLEGLIPSDPRAQIGTRFLRDVEKVQALGYVYAATGDPRYAERAGAYMEAWAQTNQPDGNPINETAISRLVRGFSVVAESLSPVVRQHVKSWLTKMATVEIESRTRFGSTNAMNNWHSHRLKIVGLIGYALGNDRFIRYAEDGYRAQIGENLRPDGSSFDFHHRDALHYHVYNLEPLTELALASDKRGVDLYAYVAPSGASLERSIAFLLPYVRGEKVHYEFVRSPIALDRQRGEAGIPGFLVGAPWDPRRGARLLEMAGSFNPSFANEPIAGQGPRTFQTVLNGLRHICARRQPIGPGLRERPHEPAHE